MNLYDIEVKDNQGQLVCLKQYEGKVLLIVNTAIHCGFTSQYEGLQELYELYHDSGLEILDFPCNQFHEQASESDEEINQFCTLNYHTTFPRFEKIDVNGEHQHILYKYLKDQQKGLFSEDIKWNFTKFLVDKKGEVIKRYPPIERPISISKKIEELL
ncbi:MAG: glutathione peroxidase [Erysipelotrichaceae bacterium]